MMQIIKSYLIFMKSILSFLIASLIGTTIVVNGVAVNSQDLIEEARQVVAGANLHQIRTALEVYYLDKNSYPQADNSAMMFEILRNAGYLITLPQNASSFDYQSLDNGQDYILSLNE